MGENGVGGARPQLQRSYLGAGAAAVMALVLALAAVLGAIDPRAAAQGCVALALLVAAFYALLRSGRSARSADPSLIAAQLAAAFLLLAWLTFRSGGSPAVSMLYMVAMLYGVLRLERGTLVVLAAVATVTHGTALFMLIDHGQRAHQPALWAQFGALAAGLFWFAFVADAVARLRGHLTDAHRRLHDLGEEARARASRDALTGAFHRHHLVEALEREVSRADRLAKPLCVARVDLDRFRALNETFGSGTGDAVLRRFALVSQGVLRDIDVFGRYGGKEFLVVMPDTGMAGALIAADRLRAALERTTFPELRAGYPVSCTIGLAEHARHEPAGRVLARAEAGLNYGKAAGRDLVVAVGADGAPLPAAQQAA